LGAKALLVVYAVAAALLPLGHHDVACHLKSPTHCTTCVVGSSAETTADATTLLRHPLSDAGRATGAPVVKAASAVPDASSGRSPPAAT
jgi:hypothetical protein